MERHLDILAEELAAALPERAAEFGKLHEAACALRRERRAVLPQKSFDALAWAFARQAAEPIPRFGELALSAACDEACGIDAAVTSVTSWLEANETLPADWRASARDLIAQARKLVRQPQA